MGTQAATSSATAELITRARDYLRNGWGTVHMYDMNTGCVCALGALVFAAGHGDLLEERAAGNEFGYGDAYLLFGGVDDIDGRFGEKVDEQLVDALHTVAETIRKKYRLPETLGDIDEVFSFNDAQRTVKKVDEVFAEAAKRAAAK